jgi:hypothetical protein
MKKYLGLCTALFLPLYASAAMFGGIRGAIISIIEIVGQLRGLVVGLALLYFFWGIATYIRAAGDEKELDKGKRIMIWGVVALFVMTSVGGLVRFLQNELGVSGGGVLQIVAPSGQGASNSSGSSNGGSSSNTNNAPFGSTNDPYVPPCGIDSATGEPCPSGPTSSVTSGSTTGDSPAGYAPCGPDSYDEIPCL